MSKKCNITPQVFNSTEYVDSKLFISLQNGNKTKGLKGIKLREKTKQDYEFINSSDFVNLYGDWKLYQAVKFGSTTAEQDLDFVNIYNSDITKLEASLPLSDLNDLLEPTLNFGLKIEGKVNITKVSQLKNGIITSFNSIDDLSKMAKSLNLDDTKFIDLLLTLNKDIHIKDSGYFITTQTTKEVAPKGNSIGALYGYGQDTITNELPNTNTSDYLNVESLITDYDNATINYLSKLVSSLVVGDYNNFIKLFEDTKKGSLSNYAQMEKINRFIGNKINNFKTDIIKSIDNKLAENLSNTDKTFYESFKNDVLTNYNKLVEDIKYINPETGERSFIHKAIMSYMRKNYGIIINDMNELVEVESENEDGTYVQAEILLSKWNDGDALKVNLKTNVAHKLKFLIAQCVSKDTLNKTVNKLDITNKFGVNEPYSIDDVWNTFIGITISNKSKEGIITNLKNINNLDYKGALTSFISAIENDTALWNSFYSSVVLPVYKNTTIRVYDKGDNLTIQDTTNNYNSFAINIAYQQFKTNIQLNLENNNNYLSTIINKENPSALYYNPNKSIQENIDNVQKLKLYEQGNTLDKYDWIKNRLIELALPITIEDIHTYIQSKVGINVEKMGNPFATNRVYKGKELSQMDVLKDEVKNDEVKLNKLIELQNTYNTEFNNIISHLNYLTQHLDKLKSEYSKLNKKQQKRFIFDARFDQSGSLTYLANIATLKNYKNIVLSYSSVTGELEYSPQYPSYLTDILKTLTPVNGEINYNEVKEAFADFLADPVLAKNNILYNIDGSGLLNIKYTTQLRKVGTEEIIDKLPVVNPTTGFYVLDEVNPINIQFIKNFSSGQLSGTIFGNTNDGAKYDSIMGDSWKIIAIQAAMRGQFIIPSSDSSRSYYVQGVKYGLKHFMLDNNMKYVSIKNILTNVGILDNLGNVVNRTVNDITDDSQFYFEYTDPKTKTVYKHTKSLGYLKNISARKDELIEDYKSMFKGYLRTFRDAAHKEMTENPYIQKEGTDYKDLVKYTDINSEDYQNYHKVLNSKAVTTLIANNFESDDASLYKRAINDIIRYMTPLDTNTIDSMLGTSMFIDDIGILTSYKDKVVNIDIFNSVPFNMPPSAKRNHIETETNIRNLENSINNADRYLKNPQLLIDNDKLLLARYEAFKKSKQVQAIRNTVESEITAMQIAIPKMFDFNYTYSKNNIRYSDKITVKKDIQYKANRRLLSAPVEFSGYEKNTYNGNKLVYGNAKVLENGVPTGKLFKFNRLSYIDASGKKITLNDFAKTYLGGDSFTGHKMVELVARMSERTHPLANNVVIISEWNAMTTKAKANNITREQLIEDVKIAKQAFNNIFYSFLDNVFINNQDKFIADTKSIKSELQSMVVDYVPKYVDGTYEGKNENAKRRAYLISPHLEIAEDGKYTQDQLNRQYNRSMLELYINDYLMSSNIGEDLLYGQQYEDKNFTDWNKRVNQTFRNGRSNDSKDRFTSLTIGDVETVTNMLSELSTNNNIDSSVIFDRYKDEVEVGNALSMITVDEAIKRLKAVNMYEGELKDYIQALTNPKIPFDTHKYTYIAEQLKYFLYARQKVESGIMTGTVRSYQEKNSTIILFPKMFNNTKYEAISNWMSARNIDELNFASGSKRGGQPIFYLHDTFKETIDGKDLNYGYQVKTLEHNGKVIFDDRIDRTKPYSDKNIVDINEYLISYKYADLRVQQDTVSHIYNENGIISTQWIKKIDVNMNDTDDYVIGGVTYKGRTNNPSKRGIYENRQYSMSYNAELDRDLLIAAWGGMENGEIKYNEKGYIDLDVNKIRKSIQDYYFNTNDISMMRAFQSLHDNKNESLISLNHPTIQKAVEQLLQAKITNNVKQELKQIHAPIIPDTFIQPLKQEYGKKDILGNEYIKEYKEQGIISYTKEFWKECEESNNFELKAEYYDVDGKFHPAQIVTNVWDKQFDKYRKTKVVTINDKLATIPYIDIDEIPVEARTMVLTRIPHEGMQSSSVVEVVGFFNNDASQVMVPKHLSKRTGWDYDIDTVYIYPKNLYTRSDGKLYPISYEYDTTHKDDIYNTKERMITEYVKNYHSDKYNKLNLTKSITINKLRNEFIANVKQVSLDVRKENREFIVEYSKNPSNEDFAKQVAKVIEIAGDYTSPELESLKRYITASKENFTIDSQAFVDTLNSVIDDLNTNYDSTTLAQLDILLENSFLNQDKYYALAKQNIKDIIGGLKDQLKLDIQKANETFEIGLDELINDKDIVAKFNSFPELKQLTRATRDNIIVDSFEARLKHKESTVFRDKPNEFDNLSNMSDYINSKYGINDSLYSSNNLLDRVNVTNMNKSVGVLKAHSVSNDNIFSVFGTLNVSLGNQRALPIVVSKSEFNIEDSSQIIDRLNDVVGINNYIEVEDKFIIFVKHIGNNINGSWTNIQNEYITDQSSEITANILDAVKKPLGFNIDTNTLNILSILANTPVSHNTDITGKGKKNNSFAYANLLIHQPIITKYLNAINAKKRFGEYGDKNYILKTVKNDIYSNIIETIAKVDILTGTVTDLNTYNLLDLFHNYLNNRISEDSNSNVNAITKINEWRKNVSNGEKITMYDNTGISSEMVYNKFIEFIQNTDILEDEVYKFINGNFDKSEIDDAKALFEKSKIKDFLSTLSLEAISYNPLFEFKNNKVKYDSVKPFKSLTELKDIYESSIDNKYYDIDSYMETISNNETTDTKTLSDFVNFLDNQIAITKVYEQIDKAGELINRASAVMRTDKLGTSPNSSKTSKLFDDLSSLYIDYKSFETQLKNVGYNNGKLNDFKNLYFSEQTITGRIDVIKNIITLHNNSAQIDFNDLYSQLENIDYDKLEETKELFNDSESSLDIASKILDLKQDVSERYKTKLEVRYYNTETKSVNSNSKVNKPKHINLTIPYTGLYVKDTQIAESVFPNAINNTLGEQFDFTKSSYPYFEAQLNYANYFSTVAFKDVLLTEKPSIKKAINVISARLNVNANMGAIQKSQITNRILLTIINSKIYDETSFFNGGSIQPTNRREEILRVMGNVNVDELFVVNDEGNIEKVEVELDENENVNYIKLDKVPTLGEYKNLSVANQVYLLQNAIGKFNVSKPISNINNVQLFLSLFEASIGKKSILDNGYHRLTTKNTERDMNKMQQVFREMFFNTNPFIRQTARDLIRYSFHTSGLQFGNNVAKYVDISLFYERSAEYDMISEQEEPERNRLYYYGNKLKQLETNDDIDIDKQTIDYYIDIIHRQMSDENRINPIINKKRKGTSSDEPTWTNYLNFKQEVKIGDNVLNAGNYPIIIEDSYRLNNSRYSRNEYIRTKVSGFNIANENLLMKRFVPEGSTKVYYYPVSKCLPYEYSSDGTSTVINKYSLGIKEAAYYESIIRYYDEGRTTINTDIRNSESLYTPNRVIENDARANIINTDGYIYSNVITKSDKTYSQTAQDLISSVDFVLVVGNNPTYKEAFKSSRTIYTDLSDINSKTLESIPFDKPTKLAIVGDTLSDLGLTQQEVDKIIVPTIRGYKAIYNIDSIKTIFKNGIGESIYKATFTDGNNNEYIEVGERDNIRNVESLDDNNLGNTSLLATTFNIEDVTKTLLETNTMILRQYDDLKTYTKVPIDSFKFDVEGLKSLTAEMNETQSRMAAMIKSLEVNENLLNKIVEFISKDGFRFPNEDKNYNIFNLNILKFLDSEDISSKNYIASKLDLYHKLIGVANNVLSIKAIQMPNVTDANFQALSQEEKDEIISVRNSVIEFNNKLSSIRNSIAVDSTGTEILINPKDRSTSSKINMISVFDKNVKAKTNEYFGSIITLRSRNPKFKNTRFSQIVNKIIEEGYDVNDTIKAEITPETLVRVFRESMLYNDDLTFQQLWLDSVRDTGVALVDNAMSLFTENKINSLELKLNRLEELKSILNDYKGLSNKSMSYSAQRNASFKSKFITEDGTFVSKYDWKKVYSDKKAIDIKSKQYKDEYDFIFKSKDKVNLSTDYIFYKKEVKDDNGESRYIANVDNKEYKVEKAIKSQLEEVPLLKLLLQDYKNDNLIDTNKEIIAKFLKENKVTDSTLDFNFNYYKIMSYEKDGKTKDILIKTNLDNTIKNSNDIYVNVDGKYMSKTDLSNATQFAFANEGKDNEDSLAVYKEIEQVNFVDGVPQSNPDYEFYKNTYIEQDFAHRIVAKRSFESRYHITFKDELLSVKYADAKEGVYSTTITDSTTNKRFSETLKIYSIVPSDKYLSSQYVKLSEEEQNFITSTSNLIQDIVKDVFPTRMQKEDFIPYIFIYDNRSVKDSLKDFIGLRNIQKENVNLDVFGNTQHYLQSRSLTAPKTKDTITIRDIKPNEDLVNYETEVVKNANKKLDYINKQNKTDIKSFENISEVKAYNDYVLNEFTKANVDKMNYDIPSIMQHFIDEMYNLKTHQDFIPMFRLLSNVIASPDFKARATKSSGSKILDLKTWVLTGEKSYANNSGKDTNVSKRLEAFKPVLYKQSRTNSKFDQMLGVAHRYTSMNVMWFNLQTGMKNVMKGVSDIVIESNAGEHFDRKNLGKGMNQTRLAMIPFMAASNDLNSTSKDSAIMKHFSFIIEDHTEGKLKKQTGTKVDRAITYADTIGYFTMATGETFLQFSSLFAMMDSCRVVHGQVMTKSEFINERKFKVVKKLLTPELLISLDDFITKKSEDENSKYHYQDYVGKWLRYNSSKITNVDEINKALTEETNKATEQFEGKKSKDGKLTDGGFKKVYDYYNFNITDEKSKEGKLESVAGFTTEMETVFINKVQSLNQSIHGIYNTIDRNAIQNMMFGEIIFQFRKWMRPTWKRWMGTKHNPFNERLGVHETGAFADFFNFMKTPYMTYKYNTKEEGTTNNPMKAMVNIMGEYAKFFKQLSFNYNTLNNHEKANVRRTVAFITAIIGISATVIGLSHLFDDDDDDDKVTFNHAEQVIIYNLMGLQTEFTDIIPVIGWATFYKQTKQNIVPMERSLNNIASLMFNSIAYPLRTNEEREYQRGVYAGEDKVDVSFNKAIPLMRQIHKEMYLESYINYYNMINPLFNVIN